MDSPEVLPATTGPSESARSLAVEAPEAEGLALLQQGRANDAVHFLEELLPRWPQRAEIANALGRARVALGERGRALDDFRAALQIRPGYAEAHFYLGHALLKLDRPAEAVVSFQAARRFGPNTSDVCNNLGVALLHAGRPAEAVDLLRETLRLRPDHVGAFQNLSVAWQALGQLSETVAARREVVRLRPDAAEAHLNLGLAFADSGDLDAAVTAYREAIRRAPELVKAHLALAMTQLRTGNFREGWREYEWRSQTAETPWPTFPQPRWDGSPAEGRTLLLHAEQGWGDTLQFVRYAPMLTALGWRTRAVVPAPLVALLSRCPGLDRVVALGGPLPDFDVWTPLLSLPLHCDTDLDSIPAALPYLTADPGRTERWRSELAAVSGFKVGIVWQGNPKQRKDKNRSAPLSCFRSLTDVPGVRIFSLQKGPGRDQLAQAAWPLVDLDARIDNDGDAFQDTAAVLLHLDLVVTVDTALAHLAGGLGVPVWAALPFAPDWRWLDGREDSPWYPTMRLFQQQSWGNWDEVFGRIAAALREQVVGPIVAGEPCMIETTPGELADRLTATVVREESSDPDAASRAREELQRCARDWTSGLLVPEELDRLLAELETVQRSLASAETELRRFESVGYFGSTFVARARFRFEEAGRRERLIRSVDRILAVRGNSVESDRAALLSPETPDGRVDAGAEFHS